MGKMTMALRGIAAVVLMALACAPESAGQELFSMTTVDVSWTSNVHGGLLHQYWKPGRGVEINVATTLGAGFFESGIAGQRYEPLEDVWGFGALWLYGGWGARLQGLYGVTLGGSARLGIFRMTFDNVDHEFSGVANESEMARMFCTTLSIPIAGAVSFVVSASHLRVYTFQRMSLWFASAGLRYAFSTPERIKNFLR